MQYQRKRHNSNLVSSTYSCSLQHKIQPINFLFPKFISLLLLPTLRYNSTYFSNQFLSKLSLPCFSSFFLKINLPSCCSNCSKLVPVIDRVFSNLFVTKLYSNQTPVISKTSFQLDQIKYLSFSQSRVKSLWINSKFQSSVLKFKVNLLIIKFLSFRL